MNLLNLCNRELVEKISTLDDKVERIFMVDNHDGLFLGLPSCFDMFLEEALRIKQGVGITLDF